MASAVRGPWGRVGVDEVGEVGKYEHRRSRARQREDSMSFARSVGGRENPSSAAWSLRRRLLSVDPILCVLPGKD